MPADVWNTTFRVSIVSILRIPFTVKRPLPALDKERNMIVSRGRTIRQCVLEADVDVCRIDLLSFPEEMWSSADPAYLEYNNTGIPLDPVASSSIPFIKIAKLIPTGMRLLNPLQEYMHAFHSIANGKLDCVFTGSATAVCYAECRPVEE